MSTTIDTTPVPKAATVAPTARVMRFHADIATNGGSGTDEWRAAATAGGDVRQFPEYAGLHLTRDGVPRSLPGMWIALDHGQNGLQEPWSPSITTDCQHAVLLPKRYNLPRPISWVRPHLEGYWLAGNGFFQSFSEARDRVDAESVLRLATECSKAVLKERADFLLIEDIEKDTLLFQATRCLIENGWQEFSPTGWQPRWRIRFPATAADYWAKFNSKRRGNLRRQQRKFGGDVVRITEPDRVEWFLDQAADISRKTWQTRVLGQRVSASEFEHRYFELAAKSGALRSYVLVKDGAPVSFAIGLQSEDRFSLEEIGYDPAHAEWSPGMVLLCHMLDDLLADRTPREFDFGGGDAAYKHTLANHESVSGSVWLVAPGISRRATLGMISAANSARKFGRDVARHWTKRRHEKPVAQPTAPRDETPREE